MLTRSQSIGTASQHHVTMSDQDPKDPKNAEGISEAVRSLITETVRSEVQSLSSSLSFAMDENKDLKARIATLEKRLQLTEGLLQQAKIKINMQNEKIIDLQARSMRENLVIRGVAEKENESWNDTANNVVEFMKTELKINDANSSMIDRAHRVGQKTNEKPRNIVVKFTSSKFKDKLFQNVKNLAGKKQFSVNEQLPQEVQERRNRLWPKFKEAKEKSKHDKSMKVKWSFDKLNINGKLHSAKDDLQNVTSDECLNMHVNIESSKQYSETGSIFQGHAAQLTRGTSIAGVLASLYSNPLIAKAEHNMYAYRLKEGDGVVESCSDDGEHGAGNKLLRLLQERSATDVVVVCTRWFGGVHIGPKRFGYITSSATDALNKLLPGSNS